MRIADNDLRQRLHLFLGPDEDDDEWEDDEREDDDDDWEDDDADED